MRSRGDCIRKGHPRQGRPSPEGVGRHPLCQCHEVEERSALLFSASLSYLGVLGDRHFHWFFGALTLCVPRTQKGPIAEDAEVTEARREKTKP
jgi:hypothetical protein